MVPSSALVPGSLQGERSLLGLGGSSMQAGLFSHRASTDTGGSPSSSARPTDDAPPAAAGAAAAAAVFLSDTELARQHKVLLQETDNIIMWEVPGAPSQHTVAAATCTAGYEEQRCSLLGMLCVSSCVDKSTHTARVTLCVHRGLSSVS